MGGSSISGITGAAMTYGAASGMATGYAAAPTTYAAPASISSGVATYGAAPTTYVAAPTTYAAAPTAYGASMTYMQQPGVVMQGGGGMSAFDMLDTNHDGSISWAEFGAMMR